MKRRQAIGDGAGHDAVVPLVLHHRFLLVARETKPTCRFVEDARAGRIRQHVYCHRGCERLGNKRDASERDLNERKRRRRILFRSLS